MKALDSQVRENLEIKANTKDFHQNLIKNYTIIFDDQFLNSSKEKQTYIISKNKLIIVPNWKLSRYKINYFKCTEINYHFKFN